MAFEPTEMARPAVEPAAARWSAAMGCDVTAGPGGIPVVASSRLYVEYDADGNSTTFDTYAPGRKPICGLASWNAERTAVVSIRIALNDPACSGEYAAAHEMGHAIVGVQGHTLTGVLAAGNAPGKSTLIDEASLEAACSALPCQAFEPEHR